MSIYHKLKNILPKITNPVIVEIGAHIGTDTVKIARLLQKPYLYFAIEPDSRNFPQLLEVCDNLGITHLPVAIGDKTGDVDFWFSSGGRHREFTDCSSLKKPIDDCDRPKWIKFQRGNVHCATLDGLLFNDDLEAGEWLDHIDLIWMDVQGAELEVIRGATEALKRTRYLYTECQEGRYEGQPGFAKIMMALDGVWEIVYNDPANVLLKNGDI